MCINMDIIPGFDGANSIELYDDDDAVIASIEYRCDDIDSLAEAMEYITARDLEARKGSL